MMYEDHNLGSLAPPSWVLHPTRSDAVLHPPAQNNSVHMTTDQGRSSVIWQNKGYVNILLIQISPCNDCNACSFYPCQTVYPIVSVWWLMKSKCSPTSSGYCDVTISASVTWWPSWRRLATALLGDILLSVFDTTARSLSRSFLIILLAHTQSKWFVPRSLWGPHHHPFSAVHWESQWSGVWSQPALWKVALLMVRTTGCL